MAKNTIQVDGVSILMIESWFGPFVAHARRPQHVAMSREVLQDAALDRLLDSAAIPKKNSFKIQTIAAGTQLSGP